MANLFLPYGLRHTGFTTGHPGNFGMATDKIAMANATPIFFGDPLVRLPSGYLAKAPVGATQIHGVFLGCRYLSVVKGYTNYSLIWPGNGDALGDAAAIVVTTSDATFQVQTGNSAVAAATAPLSIVGENIGFAYGTANLRTGISACYADLSTVGTTASLPFKVLALVSDPPSVNGADTTTPFGDILIGFNNSDYHAPTAGI